MRLIPLLRLAPDLTQEWKDEARNSLSAVANLAADARAEEINGRRRVWRGLSVQLGRLSNNKCWYCESRQIRSNKDVDHFRPKNRVAESKSSEGYWWLAFDWRNYRYSCNFCNSRHKFTETAGGKGDHFPLVDENARGAPRATPDDLDAQEEPKLLDPTNLKDVALLTFDEDGNIAPAVKESDDPVGYARALASIEIYHLREVQLREARRQKMDDVRQRLRVAKQLPPKSPALRDEITLLALAIGPEAEYSAAARAMLRLLRAEYPLAETILEGA
jgi:uncharacterized protein (TIGR02646 family)